MPVTSLHLKVHSRKDLRAARGCTVQVVAMGPDPKNIKIGSIVAVSLANLLSLERRLVVLVKAADNGLR